MLKQTNTIRCQFLFPKAIVYKVSGLKTSNFLILFLCTFRGKNTAKNEYVVEGLNSSLFCLVGSLTNDSISHREQYHANMRRIYCILFFSRSILFGNTSPLCPICIMGTVRLNKRCSIAFFLTKNS